MEAHIEIRENWITRKVSPKAFTHTLVMIAVMLVAALIYFGDYFNSLAWMAASGEQVFKEHEYWRLWTTLFAHGDLAHLLGNLLLFAPFAYFLSGHFGIFFFPFVGFLIGGLTNVFVLSTMPAHISLIGVSGVVYWMGAAWMTLAYLIDRREGHTKRIVRVLGVSMILFLPDTFREEVSYLSHFVGYVLGVISGFIFFLIYRKQLRSAEVVEVIYDDDFDIDLEQ